MTLPRGWVEAPLGVLANKIGSGATPRGGREAYGQHGVPLIRSMNVHFGAFRYDGLAFLDHQQADALANVEVRANDVLLNITGASIGRVCLAPSEVNGARVNQHVCIIRPEGDVAPRYLEAFFAAPEMQRYIVAENYGLTRQALTKGMIEQILVPLPPATEQRRIVAKLDALTARLARARAELDRVPKLVNRFRRQALQQCFAARDGAASVTLGTILTAIQSGKNMRCVERPPQVGERGVVKVSAVTWGRFDPAQSKTLPVDYVPPKIARIRAGDLLISRANTLELVGKPVIVEDEPRDLFLSDKILRLVVAPNKKKWVLWFLRSPEGRRQIEVLSSGNQKSMRNIGQQAIRQIEIPLPCERERDQLLVSLESAFARADRLEAEAARARALLDRLESAILAKAFRGELVPQDPDDEPARVLLDRMRAERAAAPAKPRRRAAKAA